MSKSESLIFIGMDVHQDTVTLAVFEGASKEAAVVQKLPNDLRKLRRFFDRWAKRGEIRTCYEASGAGYVLYHELTEWGHSCEIIAPSLTPIRPGEQRKHDRHDAIQLARLYRAGELVPIRIPSPNEERVRRPRAVSSDVSARDPTLSPLHPEVPQSSWLRLPAWTTLGTEASGVAGATPTPRTSRTTRPYGVQRVSSAHGLQGLSP